VDALTGLLNGPRARGAFLLRASLDPPWCLRVQDQAPLTLVAVMRGEALAVPDEGDVIRLRPGDVAIMRGPDPYTMADDPATPVQAVIHPGEQCTTPDGEPLHQAMDQGVRTWGNSPDGATMLLVGTYELVGEISQRLLGALPAMLVLRAADWETPIIALLGAEIVKDEPGQEVVLDRLLDLLLIAVLRAWFSRPEAGAPTWYQALSDPVVGTTMRMLHNNPEHPWTVAALAAKVGVSRAALARRFHDLVGDPPMTYLTNWRLDLAADMLLEQNATIGAVARQVGYASPFALSTAFKRVRGISPQQHRYRAYRPDAQEPGRAGDSDRV